MISLWQEEKYWNSLQSCCDTELRKQDYKPPTSMIHADFSTKTLDRFRFNEEIDKACLIKCPATNEHAKTDYEKDVNIWIISLQISKSSGVGRYIKRQHRKYDDLKKSCHALSGGIASHTF